MSEALTSDNPLFWQSRYKTGSIPWDLAEPAPPFVQLLQSPPEGIVLPPGKMAVLGSGYGNDAAFFARQGFDVTGFDFVPEAVAQATQLYGDTGARFVEADLFNLPPETAGLFDYVLEHTCFCAIRPNQRAAYVEASARLLKPGGVLIGLFWAHHEMGGPPYKTDEAELRRLFSPPFELCYLAITPHSIPARQNEEFLGIFSKVLGV